MVNSIHYLNELVSRVSQGLEYSDPLNLAPLYTSCPKLIYILFIQQNV